MKLYILIEVGCLECGNATRILGVSREKGDLLALSTAGPLQSERPNIDAGETAVMSTGLYGEISLQIHEVNF